MRPRRTTRADRILLGGAFLFALAVRLLSVPAATTGGLRLVSPDCYAHLRRAAAVARSFPRVPVRDAWLNHPEGGVFIWPPAFDLLVGGTARLAYGADATQNEVARVLATLPPLLGALHVVPLFFLVRRVLSRRRAALAAAAYALLPAAAIWSQFGHGDHHVAETLLFLLLLHALARAREAGLAPGSSLRRAVLAGGAVAAMVLTWQGAVFAAALAFLWAALALRPREAVLLALSATGLTVLGTAPYVAGLDLPFTFVSFGWFQPVLLVAGSTAVALIVAFRARDAARRAFVGLALVLAAATLPFALPLSSAVLRGSRYVAVHTAGASVDEMDRGGYLSYPKDFLGVVAEARPLVRPPLAATLRTAVEELSPGFVLLPVALVLWSRRPDRRLLALFGGALFLMTLSQQRNVYYLAPFAAMALAEALARLAPRGRMRPAPAAIAAAALLVGLPGLPHYGRIVGYAGAPGSDLVETLERFRALAPPPRRSRSGSSASTREHRRGLRALVGRPLRHRAHRVPGRRGPVRLRLAPAGSSLLGDGRRRGGADPRRISLPLALHDRPARRPPRLRRRGRAAGHAARRDVLRAHPRGDEPESGPVPRARARFPDCLSGAGRAGRPALPDLARQNGHGEGGRVSSSAFRARSPGGTGTPVGIERASAPSLVK